MKTLHIFKQGKQTTSAGDCLFFSEADIAATARVYDPKKHEAPIVVGHPKVDAPAYGWIGSLSFDPQHGLTATPTQVDPAFSEMVTAGRFKKISASFYPPESSANPTPGFYYLRHVGFLGAEPPAVKGLKPVEFGEDNTGIVVTVDFSEYSDSLMARMIRRVRDYFIDKEGLEKADQIIPDWEINALDREVTRESMREQEPSTQFNELNPPPKETMVTPEEKATLEAENQRLKQQLADVNAAKAQAAKTARHTEHLSYAESLVTAKKLLPAHKELVVAVLDAVVGEQPLEFGEGEHKQPIAKGFKALLDGLPVSVLFSETATKDRAGAPNSVDFSAPHGATVDSEQLAKHGKALDYAAKHGVDYITAVRQVEKQA